MGFCFVLVRDFNILSARVFSVYSARFGWTFLCRNVLAPHVLFVFLFFLFISVSYGGPQVSHQIQIPHIKYKFLTSKTNSPLQNQIYHIKHKFATAKTNSPHQKQICHSKNKFLTSKTNISHQNQKHRLNGQRSMNESYLQFSLGLHPTAILFLHMIQYVVLGPRIKNYNLEYLTSRAEIFPEDTFYGSRDHLKVASSKRKYFSCNSKKGDLARGPLVRESFKQHE